MILLDTNVVIWLAFEERKISKRARATISDARRNAESLAISAITLLELAALRSKNRISFGMSLESFLGEVEKRFVILPLTSRVCARAVEFTAMIPRDPADRIILATAMTEGIPLLTADRAIRQFSVARTIW